MYMNEALISHIKDLNAKSVAWRDRDPSHRSIGLLVEDPKHWTNRDGSVMSVEQFRVSMARSEYSDVYKSVFGMRPGCSEFGDMTGDEAEKFVDDFLDTSLAMDHLCIDYNPRNDRVNIKLADQLSIPVDKLINWLEQADRIQLQDAEAERDARLGLA